jgi:hypothetical protein
MINIAQECPVRENNAPPTKLIKYTRIPESFFCVA